MFQTRSYFLVNLFMLCFTLPARAQVDTALALPLVTITEKPLRTQTVGGRTQNWPAEQLQQKRQTNLADWLAQEGGLYIKSYGNGSIATTSIRGGSAAHTSVLWNGLPIQSPMLGQLDFSLFPIAFVDQVQVHYGGNSAAWGSGAIGGLISLQNQLQFDSTRFLRARTTLGSFGFYDQQLQVADNHGRWGFHTRLFHRQARNDFPYRLRADLPEKTQSNAALQQNGLLQSLYWKPGDHQELVLYLWAQQSDREIPPTTVQNQSLARQADDFIRTALHWKSIRAHTVWQTRIGLFRETINYQDDLIRLRARSGFWTAHAEIEGTRAWKEQQQLYFGISHTWMTATADAYEARPQQNRSAPFLSYRRQWGRWQLQANVRQEIVDGRFLPLVPGLGLDGRLRPWLSVQGKLSRNYRLPTLNDLYWQPGGNPDLLPETGWSQEIGLRLHARKAPQVWSFQMTAFNRNIKNWILWSKPEEQPFWSSNNIAEVWSRGLEQRLQWTWSAPGRQLQLLAGYDYILSTNEVALANPKLEEGAQLVYVPKQQAFGSLTFRWKALEFRYQHTYTGTVSSLNSGLLPAYQLGCAALNYQLGSAKWEAQLFFQVNNLWDVDYRVIERQAMPRRHFQLGVQMEFRQKHE